MSEYNNSDQNNNDNREEYCSICHRPSSAAGRMVHMPNGVPVCNDCMQRMMNMASSMDLSGLFGNPDFMKEMNDQFRNMMQSGYPGMGFVNGPAAPETDSKENTAAPEELDPMKTETGISAGQDPEQETSADPEKAETGGDDSDDSKDKHEKKPTISFLNLGDIFGMNGMPNQQRPKKVKKNRPKPVFSIDDMPAPHIIKAKLDEYVVGQEHAKKVLSVAVYNHYKRVKTGHMDDIDIEKSNILMIGPTGCGKTYLVKTLAQLLDVPLAITDATSLTEAGYIGDDIESVISKLLDAADDDVERTERGIVFIDEIDKIAKKSTTTSRDVNGESVQQGMLKLLEGAEVEVPVGASSKNAMVPMQMINTRNILFICGGAFPHLNEIIKERLTKRSGFGYSAELKDRYDSEKDLLSHVTNEDLRKFGFIPEFIGRLPVTCTLEGLTKEMLIGILAEPRNAIVKQYQKLLALDDVDLEFSDGSLEAIAEKALEKETGARALRAIIEEFMLDIMYEVPKDKNIGKVTITREYIEGTGGPVIEIREFLPEAGRTPYLTAGTEEGTAAGTEVSEGGN